MKLLYIEYIIRVDMENNLLDSIILIKQGEITITTENLGLLQELLKSTIKKWNSTESPGKKIYYQKCIECLQEILDMRDGRFWVPKCIDATRDFLKVLIMSETGESKDIESSGILEDTYARILLDNPSSETSGYRTEASKLYERTVKLLRRLERKA